MENGLNFGKAIEAAKAGKRVARAGSRNVRIHSSCIHNYRCKYSGKKSLSAYWALNCSRRLCNLGNLGLDSLAEDWSILD
jgi:hypothetical protein